MFSIIFSLIVHVFMISNITPVYNSGLNCPLQANDFNKDLSFIQKTLLENHPGVCNELDPTFNKEIEKNFKTALQQLNSAKSDEEKAKILQELGHSFNDAHLWICYNFDKNNAQYEVSEIRPFNIEKLNEEYYWINIPNFHPSKDQIQDLNRIIESLPQLREKKVIFDLRGNGGGNSAWGEELLQALFGKEYAIQQLAKSKENVYTEWRVSQGNLEHVKELISLVTEQQGSFHPIVLRVEYIYKGIKDALSQKKNFYSEPPEFDWSLSRSNATNAFDGRIIAIIDKRCGSACLGFLDGLKAMNANVTFVGEPTGVDSVYMELRKVTLPSGKGTLGFPIKVYRNRPRGHNVPHLPDILYKSNLQNTLALQNFVLNQLSLG